MRSNEIFSEICPLSHQDDSGTPPDSIAPNPKQQQSMSALQDYDKLSFDAAQSYVTTKFVVSNGTAGDLVIRWEIDPALSTDEVVAYKGRFEFTPAQGKSPTVKLSCYSIGLQGRRVDVAIHEPPAGDNVKLFEPNSQGKGVWVAANPSNFEFPLSIPKTSFISPGGKKYPPKEKKIWGISFNAGTPCVIIVKSSRILHSSMPLTKMEHETAPPPDEPGGQDGEGDEE
jgi:hypothetical protein